MESGALLGNGLSVLYSHHVKEFGFWNPGIFLLLESGIQDYGIWNTDQGIKNPLTIGI